MSLSIHLITVSLITLQIDSKHSSLGVRNTWDKYYDYIVVGAGSAGAVVANRLTENPNINVLLLEAGRTQSVATDIPNTWIQLLGTEFDWNYTTVRQNNFGLASNGRVDEARGKVIGGSSSINAMLYNRGNRRGYDEWVNTFGAKGWSYAEVLPLFIKSENNSDVSLVSENSGFHGTGGPVSVSSDPNPQEILLMNRKAMNELGFKTIDINGDKQMGTAIAQSFINSRTGMRSSTGNAYIDPNPHPNNLHILTNAFVVKILFSESNDKIKAIGVQFIKNNQTFGVKVKKEVILSAGVFNSPQLLMLSGIGPKNHLKKLKIKVRADLPVGDNLLDHPSARVYAIIKDNIPLHPLGELNSNQLLELYVNHSGPLSRFTTGFTYFSTKSNPTKEWPNMLIETQVENMEQNLISIFTNRSDEWTEYLRPYFGKISLEIFAYVYRPRSYGSLRLVSNNPYDYPLIDPKFLSNPRDFEDMVETLKFIYYYLIHSSLAQYVNLIPKPIPGCELCANVRHIYECDSYIRCVIQQTGASVWHPVGTCRMGAVERSDVVVDPELRVKGIVGLRVCDASVIPRIPNANTNAASIMIGEKCSQIIKQDFNRFKTEL